MDRKRRSSGDGGQRNRGTALFAAAFSALLAVLTTALLAHPAGAHEVTAENGVFQYRSEYTYTEDPKIRLMPIGDDALRSRLVNLRRDGRRGDAWRPLDPDRKTASRALEDGGAFVEWYEEHEGAFYLGDPLSERLRERGVTVQYFEGGLLAGTADGEVRLAPLANELAAELGIETKWVEQGDLPLFDESLFWTAPNPSGEVNPDTPGVKRIEVSVGEQRLRAYQGDELVLETPVSTGLAPNLTELGRFHVRYKLEKEDMRGFTGATGEVISVGTTDSGGAGGDFYELEDVPHVMYINDDLEALHGAYWHNNFGQPMSHGCINLPLEVARFLYGWAPLGTQVRVHE